MPRRDGLEDYRSKRDFQQTSEPGARRGGRTPEAPRFVVQKHDARSLHYDFRLESDGVLKSWAVPKGPPTDPSEKVLATPTEDHPLEYEHFEGVIPQGEYGAGPVVVWDTGTYHNITEDHGEPVPMAEALRRGHVAVRLEGKKLRGDYALTKMRRRDTPGWLLVKMRDDKAGTGPDPRRDRPESVRSGRTLRQLKRDAD
ncbi:MAG TPA: DNA polymerase ligase N-terminal domain-containing protein [Trebonia sp.]|nr:DNA polymerase ligase N-terminal domain-containing protein [Trebonia sp.]